ncbi:MAG: hypothetical protein HS116_28505 [Planctomycetes bacterium]|nr:hypothetical protein [Planctomycetota bacterium]
MFQGWTFGQKIGAGFAATVLTSVVIAVLSVFALRSVVENKDRVIEVNAANLLEAQKLDVHSEEISASIRGYLLIKDERRLDDIHNSRTAFQSAVGRLRKQMGADEAGALDRIEQTEQAYGHGVDSIIKKRQTEQPIDQIAAEWNDTLVAKRRELASQVQALVDREKGRLESAKKAASELASSTTSLVLAIALAGVGMAVGLAFFLTSTLSRQIGTAIQHVQSSSSELQAAANQQASGAKEQATAMNEIGTTISELLATSRQIAQSAQRVAQIAAHTAAGAGAGDQTVQKAQEAVSGIRRQVDLIVNHMLDLGKKSQQIGGILEIINELAEQTNILSINASIEAAGAGEAGKRFGVVADEIRKLADRVAGSTKEIRGLIEEIRAAVNTTVMATESGSKAVDSGMRQFNDVAASFKEIGTQVETTTEAAEEIELSTKQQSTAVEQVNLAISNVAQATKEMEASSMQTMQTATQLTNLSQELARLIQAQRA